MLLFASIATFAQSPHAAQLYGMTQYGGLDHKGTIFHVNPSVKTMTVDYQFKLKYKGKNPKCDIVAGNNGKYYGTASGGGLFDAGVIFEWDSTTNVYTELYDFTGTDGQDPRGGMVLNNNKLYGFTRIGGANNFGVIYELDIATNIYTKKYDMDSINGKNPDGSLSFINNTFYGVTHNGGSYDKGVLFEWNPATNIYTKKNDFDSINGSNPVGKLIPAGVNKLYAMTNKGGTYDLGTLYEYNYATNVITTKYNFNGINGQYPVGSLAMHTNNKFYGFTYEGGTYETPDINDHFGVLFEYNPATNLFVKKRDMGQVQFGGSQSSHGVVGTFALKDDVFFSSGTEGLGANGCIFSYNPSTGIFVDLYYNHADCFGCNIYQDENWWQAPGSNVYGKMLVSGNKLIAAAADNGADRRGLLYQYNIDSNQVEQVVHLAATDGSYPKGSLTKVGKKLFGLTYLGGDNHHGNIFEWDVNTQQFTNRFEFNGYTTNVEPKGNLYLYNGLFYGVNSYGRSQGQPGSFWANAHRDLAGGQGSGLFSWNPSNNNFQILTEATGTNIFPLNTTLALKNNKFYGIGNGGSFGSIMEFNPTTITITPNVFFSSANGGAIDQNGLVEFNGKFYGTTLGKVPTGQTPTGSNSFGSIYEFDPVTNIITNKIDLNDTLGINPTGDLTLVDSTFYGLCSGGFFHFGAIFKWSPITNVYTKLVDFDNIFPFGNNMINPKGALTYSNGKLYGMCYGFDYPKNAYNSGGQSGGAGSFPGNLFEYDIAGDNISWVQNFVFAGYDPNTGVNPAYTKLLEIIPNKAPVLSNIPNNQSICFNQTGIVLFTISDLDLDTMQFSYSTSNPTLFPVSNFTISNIDSNYTLHYTPVANQSGSTIISVIANDGYGDSVNFSFAINVIASPNIFVSQYSMTLTANQNNATYQWIDCRNNSAIAGAINQSFTATNNGNYAVVVSTNNCSDTSACVLITTVGLDETSLQNNITIQPNPAHDKITITSMQINFSSIQIINTVGEIVLQTKNKNNQADIDVSKLPQGVYQVKIYLDKNVVMKKFMKQ